MNIRELINYMVAERDTTITELSQKMGRKNPTDITHIYRTKGGCTVNTLIDICEALDYEVVVRKKKGKDYYDTVNGIRINKQEENM